MIAILKYYTKTTLRQAQDDIFSTYAKFVYLFLEIKDSLKSTNKNSPFEGGVASGVFNKPEDEVVYKTLPSLILSTQD